MSSPSPDAGILGEPSYVWRSGQERRLNLLRAYIPPESGRVLDIGCGIGTYVQRLRQFADSVYGVDVSLRRLRQGAESLPGLLAAAGEHLPFADDVFDFILLNEVIEHVADDRQTLAEALRVLKRGGYAAIYAPNRLYPFETHGIYLGHRYIFGNVPLINYLPSPLRNRLVPHARAYRASDLAKLIAGLPARVSIQTYVYPGFDNVAGRRPTLARILRACLYRAEHSPMRRFGLSHLIVLKKI
jgi:SAM-dependent methyltransferase